MIFARHTHRSSPINAADAADAAIAPARPEHRDAILALIEGAGLPTSGVADHFPGAYVVARAGDVLVAAAGLEVHGDGGLLRSVVVAPEYRATGLGRMLVDNRLRAARELGLGAVYLLTTTAPDYFARLGFERVRRESAPGPLQRSTEFASVCPASAVCMTKRLR